jgi:hypothetical protein
MPPQIPFQLRYSLSRAQRLVPHLHIWGRFYTPFAVLMLLFFLVQTVVSVCMLSASGVVLFGGLTLGCFALLRGLYVGLLDVLLVPVREMDVIIEENAAGILAGGERWYLFLDGILDIRRFRDDTWTVQHYNGTVLHIAADAITEEQVDYLKAAMERGRTPEGVRAVIERGRQIEQILRADRER